MEDLKVFLPAIAELRAFYQRCIDENIPAGARIVDDPFSTGERGSCPLCVLCIQMQIEGDFEEDDKCKYCPWILLEGRFCEVEAEKDWKEEDETYNFDKNSYSEHIIRLDKWENKILNKEKNEKEAA